MKMRYSLSVYEVTNTKETSPCRIPREDYDLMTLVVIKLGNKVYNGEKGDKDYELLRFLNAIMYLCEKIEETVSEFIDLPQYEELEKEVRRVSGLGELMFKEGRAEGIEALILDNLEEGIPKERIIAKLQKHFALKEEQAMQYYKHFASDEEERDRKN